MLRNLNGPSFQLKKEKSRKLNGEMPKIKLKKEKKFKKWVAEVVET